MGTSGGDSGVRGFLAAYDAMTGKLEWRFWTIPGPGEFGSSSWPGDAYLTVVARPGCPVRTIRNLTLCIGPPATLHRTSWATRARGTTSIQMRSGAQSRHRRVEMVFPIHSPRLVRLRCQRNSGAGGC